MAGFGGADVGRSVRIAQSALPNAKSHNALANGLFRHDANRTIAEPFRKGHRSGGRVSGGIGLVYIQKLYEMVETLKIDSIKAETTRGLGQQFREWLKSQYLGFFQSDRVHV